MKLFLVYATYYGELLFDMNKATDIIGIFRTKEEADKKRKCYIKNDLETGEFIVDDEIKEDYSNIEDVTVFFEEQENWDSYYKVTIEEIEVR